ncbi:flagellar biosynthetic protein FliO [Marinomonas epiphytica]
MNRPFKSKLFLTAVLCTAVSRLYAADLSAVNTGYSVWKVVLALVVIVAFIPAALWLVKKAQLAQMKFNQSDIKVVSVQGVGAKEKVVLIEVEGEKVLLGVTSQAITHLKSFTPNGSAFAQVMQDTSAVTPSNTSKDGNE